MRISFFLLLAVASASIALAAESDDSNKARITGIVVDADGKPVADAEVRVIDSQLKPVHTDAEGHFSVLLESYSVFGERLVVSDPSGARMGLWELELEDYGEINDRVPFAEARVVLRPSVAIQVRVEDAGHAPVSGAEVVAMHAYQAITATRTDDTGAAVLRVPDTTEVRHVFAMKPDVGFDYMENFDTAPAWPPNQPPAKVTLILEGALTVRVKAVGSDGKPVAGVDFIPSEIRKPGRARGIGRFHTGTLAALSRTTDINGVATFDYLPSSTTEMTSFEIADESFSGERPLFWLPWSKASEAPGPVELTTHVMPMSSLKGKVSLPDGRPAPGIEVAVQGLGYGSSTCGGRTLTRKDGTFTMRVAPECSYIVSVEEPEWAVRSLTGVVVKEGHDRDDLQLQLIKGTLVRGTVTDAPAGKPVPGHQVCVIELGEKIDFSKLAGSEKPQYYREFRYSVAHSDEAGHYSIRLGPGTYRIGNTWILEEDKLLQIGDQPEMTVDLVGGSEN